MKIEDIKSRLIDDGIADVGFSDVSSALDERYSAYPYAVTLVCKISDAIIDEVVEKPTFAYFQHYRAVNAFLDNRCVWLSEMIRRLGYNAFPIAASQSVHDAGEFSGIFQHKTGARLAGLGWIGKSALFISKDFGPRVRLATVLTDMPLPISDNIMERDCGDCKICSTKCPSCAIKGINFHDGIERKDMFDARACSEYMKREFQRIGRGSVCGICVNCCPIGKTPAAQQY